MRDNKSDVNEHAFEAAYPNSMSPLPRASKVQNIYYHFLHWRFRTSIRNTNILCNKFAPRASYINRTVPAIVDPKVKPTLSTIYKFILFVIYRNKISFMGKRFRYSLNRTASIRQVINKKDKKFSFVNSSKFYRKIEKVHLKYPLTIDTERDIDWSK